LGGSDVQKERSKNNKGRRNSPHAMVHANVLYLQDVSE